MASVVGCFEGLLDVAGLIYGWRVINDTGEGVSLSDDEKEGFSEVGEKAVGMVTVEVGTEVGPADGRAVGTLTRDVLGSGVGCFVGLWVGVDGVTLGSRSLRASTVVLQNRSSAITGGNRAFLNTILFVTVAFFPWIELNSPKSFSFMLDVVATNINAQGWLDWH